MKLTPFLATTPPAQAGDIATDEDAIYTIDVSADALLSSHGEVPHCCLFPRVASSACGKSWKELRGQSGFIAAGPHSRNTPPSNNIAKQRSLAHA